MGEFDDVLAMEPGDEWDDYDAGDRSAPATELPELVAELRVPSATLQLRGEVPASVLDVLGALTVAPAAVSPDPVVVTLSIDAAGERHHVVDHDRGELGGAASDDELVRLLTAHLLEVAEPADPRQLHLRAAAVQLPDGRGVLIVDDDAGSRHALVAALLAGGAGYLGADRVVLQPGSRTVLALPTPLDGDGDPVRPEQVATATTVSVVVIIGHGDPSDETGPERLGRAHGCARLLVDGLQVVSDGHALVHAAAELVAAAAIWELVAADPAADAAAIAALDGPATHELVVVRRPAQDDPEVAIVRFRHGGVLVDVARRLAFEVAEEELPTVDAVRRPVIAREPAVDAAVFEQLAAAGIDLRPVVSQGIVRAPGPQSYGLPDSPVGHACTALWDGAAVGRALAVDPGLAVVLAHAARRGELVLDDQAAAGLAAAASVAATRGDQVLTALESVLDLLDDDGVEPLALGSVVLAHDGPLPADMVALDRIELLLATDELARCAAVLVDHGAVRTDTVDHRAPSEDPSEDPSDGPDGDGSDQSVAGRPVHLVMPDGDVEVVLRDRLAAGPFGELVDHDELLDRSVLFRLGGRWVHALHPDDRFVWACVRMSDLGAPTSQDLREVVLDAPASREGMAAALEASARWGATRTVLSAIRTVDVSMPGLSPWLVERATRPSPGPDRRRRRGNRRI